MSFVHLNIHSEYSLLSSNIKIEDLAIKLKEYNMNAAALTDFGNMFGAVEFYKIMKKNGIKPIIGIQLNVINDLSKVNSIGYSKKKLDDVYSLILLAKNYEGYLNISTLISNFNNTYKYENKIIVSLDDILKLKEVVVLFNFHNFNQLNSNLNKNILKLLETFTDDFYVELCIYNSESLGYVDYILKLRKEINFNIVATNDVYFLEKKDYYFYKLLVSIDKNLDVEFKNTKDFFVDSNSYLKNNQEMADLFINIPEAIENSKIISQKCNLDFSFNNKFLPIFNCPENINSDDYLKKLCMKGTKIKYEKDLKNKSKYIKILDRLYMELDVIKKMGYSDYFLIVWDFVRFAKKNRIRVGPGRGSGGGSIVAYVLNITEIDPIKYNLIFERFLNIDRITMPDLDIDFQDDRRKEVIDYVTQKYGKDNVVNIITFGTLKPKAVLRDVGRFLKYDIKFVDSITKLIPNKLDDKRDFSLKEVILKSKILNKMYSEDILVKKLFDLSFNLEGIIRNISIHAAGIVITPKKVYNYVPTYDVNGIICTQYNMTLLEELGFLKIDFLGLTTLNFIQSCIDEINSNVDISFNIDEIELEDSNTYNLISKGDTFGVFQLESAGMSNFMKNLKPNNIEDLIAGVSLFRPGPMKSIPQYLRNKQNPEKIIYKHPLLKNILSVTYGCVVYQEQVMEIVRVLAGYSYSRADIIRKAMSKKNNEDFMKGERKIFIEGLVEGNNIIIPGCIRNGIDVNLANQIYDEIVDFSKYAFNKSHATSYAILAYQTAYLKSNYELYFYSSLLNTIFDNKNKLEQCFKEIKLKKINILKPNINESSSSFIVKNNSIIYGFNAIKNIGSLCIEKIIFEREKNGFYLDFFDFVKRNFNNKEINKKTLEILIKCGVFDNFQNNRKTLIENLDEIILRCENNSSQIMLDYGYNYDIKYFDEFNYNELRKYEFDYLSL